MVAQVTEHFARNTQSRLMEIPIGDIVPSPLNPRKHFQQEALEELAGSIREHGLIEPIVVRQMDGEDGYSLIAGERRWRASQLAGLDVLPAVVRHEPDDGTAIRLMLIENLHRADLDPIEEAEGYRALRDLGVKQSEIAAAINRSQPVVANALRLLELPDPVRELVQSGQLSAAHGRALVKYAKWPKLCEAIAEKSVEAHWTSKALEDDLPNPYELEQKGLLAHIIGDESDNHALIAAGITVFGKGYWRMTPDVSAYKRFVTAEKQKLEEAAAKRVQKLADKAAKSGEEVLKLEKLPRDGYVQFTSWEPAPQGCPDDCSCRRQAVNHLGTVVEISIDPKHIAQLRSAEQKAANAERTARLNRHIAHAESFIGLAFKNGRIQDSTAMDRKALALIAFRALGNLDDKAISDAAKRYTMIETKGLSFSGYSPDPKSVDALCSLDPHGLIHFVLDAIVRYDLRQISEYGGYQSRNPILTDWFAGPLAGAVGDQAAPQPEQLTPAEAEIVSAQSENDPRCPQCGEPAEILEAGTEDAVWACSSFDCEWIDGMGTEVVQGSERAAVDNRQQPSASLTAEILEVGACDDDILTEEEQHARGKARGALYGHLRKAGYQVVLECALTKLDDELLIDLAHDAKRHAEHRGVDWDGLIIALEQVMQDDDDLEYSPEVEAKLADIERSKAAIAAERAS